VRVSRGTSTSQEQVNANDTGRILSGQSRSLRRTGPTMPAASSTLAF
jgi:hypothetical protein